MSKDRRSPARGSGRPRPDGAGGRTGKASAAKKRGGPANKKVAQHPRPAPAPTPPAVEDPRTFRLGVVPGATPGKWIDAWKQRMPHVALELVEISFADQRESVHQVDAAIVRLPLVDENLHRIALYDEAPVVVTSAESHLLAVDELTADDLAGEVLITPRDTVLGALDLPGTVAPAFAPLATTADAIATVATGVGIVVVPMSLARLHHRKDADHRPLRDGPVSTVALVWPQDRTTADVETFVGIVRGRTANSSR